ncbi:MAG: hypothetical protein WCA20_25165, partial [Candidatus Sulfotelmatobacter sp.]
PSTLLQSVSLILPSVSRIPKNQNAHSIRGCYSFSLRADFRLLGQQKLGPHEVYVLEATPRAGYKAPNMEAEVLTGMQGTLWIDKNTFQWVKVKAQVTHPVSIEGFLARVEPGTSFKLERMPVTDDVWLPKHFAMKSRAKILFFFRNNTQEDDTYFDSQRAVHSTTESSHNGR